MNNAQEKPVYEFGPFRLETAEHRLLRDGRIVALTPKVFETLLMLVEHHGHIVEKDELLRRVWPDAIVEEAGLAKNVSVLRKTLGENDSENSFIETIPKRGYRFIASVRLAAGESLSPAGAPPAPGKKSRIVFAAAGALCLLLLAAAGVYRWFSGAGGAPRNVRSIAVLPFKPLGDNEDDRYLGLGMADALIIRLGQLERIVVRPTSEVRQYAADPVDALTAGKGLQVEAVLEGTIQRTDDRIRVTVRLIEVGDGRQLWADKFEEKASDIFALQDAVALRAANSLTSRLTPPEEKKLARHDTENPEAFRLYVRGNFLARRFTRDGFEKAVEQLNKAVELDPNYALAYAGLSLAYHNASEHQLAPPDAMPKAKYYAERAVELDETLPEGHDQLGWVKMTYDWDWAGAEKEYRRALELNPNHENAHYSFAWYLAVMGRPAEALAEEKRVRELNPLRFTGNILYRAGDFDGVVRVSDEALEVSQQKGQPLFWLGVAYERKGMFAESIAAFDRIQPIDDASGIVAFRAYALAASGKKDAARKALTDLQEMAKRQYVSPFFFAVVYAGLGERESTLEWLEKAYAEKSYWMTGLKIDRHFDLVRGEPRFQELLRRMNLGS